MPPPRRRRRRHLHRRRPPSRLRRPERRPLLLPSRRRRQLRRPRAPALRRPGHRPRRRRLPRVRVLPRALRRHSLLGVPQRLGRDRARQARARASRPPPALTSRSPLLERWSPDGGAAAPVVLPYVDLARLIARTTPPLLRERMLHSSAESLAALKERARQELLAAGVTGFQALSSLLWRCVTRARRLAPDQEVVFRASVNNRGRLRPPLPAEYFGNSILATSTEAVPASELLARGHGWAAAAVGRAVAVHTDEAIRARAAETPSVSAFRLFDASGMFVSSSPRFDMYGCDFGWGKAVAARSGKANKYDGKVSLFPGREGGGSIDGEVELTPEHMAALEQDDEFWSAVKPDHLLLVNNNFP